MHFCAKMMTTYSVAGTSVDRYSGGYTKHYRLCNACIRRYGLRCFLTFVATGIVAGVLLVLVLPVVLPPDDAGSPVPLGALVALVIAALGLGNLTQRETAAANLALALEKKRNPPKLGFLVLLTADEYRKIFGGLSD